MYKNICVAVDGSSQSQAAVKRAASLAQIFDAELTFIHIIRPMKIPDELQRYIKSEHLTRLRTTALEEVAQEIIKKALIIAEEQGYVKVKTSIIKGDPAKKIIDQANKINADLIIVGSRGLGKVESAVIGSISRKIIETSLISTLVVK